MAYPNEILPHVHHSRWPTQNLLGPLTGLPKWKFLEPPVVGSHPLCAPCYAGVAVRSFFPSGFTPGLGIYIWTTNHFMPREFHFRPQRILFQWRNSGGLTSVQGDAIQTGWQSGWRQTSVFGGRRLASQWAGRRTSPCCETQLTRRRRTPSWTPAHLVDEHWNTSPSSSPVNTIF